METSFREILLNLKKPTTASERTDGYWREDCVGAAPSEGGTTIYLVSGHVGLKLPGFLIFQKYEDRF